MVGVGIMIKKKGREENEQFQEMRVMMMEKGS